MSQARFQKQQRETARREKALQKAARREQRREEQRSAPDASAGVDQAGVLAELAALHARFDAGSIELDEFLADRDKLTQRLAVD